VWLFGDPMSTVTSGGVDLDTWLSSVLDPKASFESVKP